MIVGQKLPILSDIVQAEQCQRQGWYNIWQNTDLYRYTAF